MLTLSTNRNCESIPHGPLRSEFSAGRVKTSYHKDNWLGCLVCSGRGSKKLFSLWWVVGTRTNDFKQFLVVAMRVPEP